MLVETIGDLIENIKTLNNSFEDGDEYAKQLLTQGRNYVFFIDEDGLYQFAPSRFVGYKDNNLEKHKTLADGGQRDGGETDKVINRLLGEQETNDYYLTQLEERYDIKCRQVPHCFWEICEIPIEKNLEKKEYLKEARANFPKVLKDQILKRANSKCENKVCKNPESFKDKDEEVFLEIHHKIPYSECKEHTFQNCIALCPNCHRQIHFGNIDDLEI